ncbi:MAG: hypothetical protein P8182_04575 [Deltaproteobacteria bacterium]
MFFPLPCKAASDTIPFLDLANRAHAFAGFISNGDTGLVQRGLDYVVPNDFHNIPRLGSDSGEVAVTVTAMSTPDKPDFFSFGTVDD